MKYTWNITLIDVEPGGVGVYVPIIKLAVCKTLYIYIVKTLLFEIMNHSRCPLISCRFAAMSFDAVIGNVSWLKWSMPIRRPTKNCQNQAKTPETLQVTENPKESSVHIYNVVMIWSLEDIDPGDD